LVNTQIYFHFLPDSLLQVSKKLKMNVIAGERVAIHP